MSTNNVTIVHRFQSKIKNTAKKTFPSLEGWDMLDPRPTARCVIQRAIGLRADAACSGPRV